MKKFRITITTTIEYEVTEDSLKNSYGGLTEFEEALALDIENAKDDPFIFIDMDNAKMEVKGEIL
jgi:hypothetical protein